jgi:hypothetical protein
MSIEKSLNSYTPVGEFDMMGISMTKDESEDPCCPGKKFDAVYYHIKVYRRPMFYIINYIFPSVLINAIGMISPSIFLPKETSDIFCTLMQFMNPGCMVFYVPNQSGEKVTLGISAMLTMVVFLMSMTTALPPATTTPLLSTAKIQILFKRFSLSENVWLKTTNDADFQVYTTALVCCWSHWKCCCRSWC